MNGILIIAHTPLASALRDCALHVFPDCATGVQALDVPADEDPETTLANAREVIARLDADGVLLLPASAAKTYGQKLAYRAALNVLAPWRIDTDVAEWLIQVPTPGDYEVRVTLAADEASAGDAYVIETESTSVKGVVQATGGYESFKEQSAGTIKLKAGVQSLLMRPDGALKQELADVRAVRLVRK